MGKETKKEAREQEDRDRQRERERERGDLNGPFSR